MEEESSSILGTSQKNLVPIAERPYGPVDTEETVEETVWHNPTDEDVVLDLYVGVQPNLRRLVKMGRKLTWEQRTGKRRYIIKARSSRAIPSEFDRGIQDMECLDPDCSQNRRDCKNRTHRRMIVGGLAPHTLRMGGLQHRPIVSDALNDKYAEEQKRKDQIATALIAKSENDIALQEAQRELARLREEIARKEAQMTSVPGGVPSSQREANLSSERSGVSAAESRIEALKTAGEAGGRRRRRVEAPPPAEGEPEGDE